MTTLEERVSYLEGKVEEHSRGIAVLREVIEHLDEKVDRRFDLLDQKVDRHFDLLDQKFSRHFLWLPGVQVVTLIAIVGALVGR